MNPVDLARELVSIPSVTDSEGAVADFLVDRLPSFGFKTEVHEISPERRNVFASTGATPAVIFCSHIDTVPPFFPSREDDEYLYGRGSCDAKGIIAAMIAAGEQLLRDGVRNFGYLLVVGEETDSIGAKRANEEFAGLGSKYVIVGEPTESKFVRATKGAMTCTVRFRGRAAHSAYPERGDSAIVKMTRAIAEIYATDWGSDESLGKATANVGVVRGGAKANIIPAEAELDMIFRTVTPIEPVRRKIESLVQRFDGEIVRCYGNDPVPMFVPEGEESVVVGFNTDAPHLPKIGQPVLFGPGSILDAHTADERISKRELVAAVETYVKLVKTLLN